MRREANISKSDLYPLAIYSFPLIPHFACLNCDIAHADGINPEKVGVWVRLGEVSVTKVLILFLFLHKNIRCGTQKHLIGQRGASVEYPHHVFMEK